MAKKILVMGLPGAGKTTLANKLKQKLSSAEHFNADIIREAYDDWDFSEEGRLRQTNRMIILAQESKKKWAILDFVCPLNEYRNLVESDIIIWMDTIKSGRYDDTNALFEEPCTTQYNYRFTDLDSDTQTTMIANKLEGK